jgi:hypothetical protein
MPRVLTCFVAIVLPAALGACATTSDDYPSLAIRDAERVSGSASAVEAPPEPPPPPLAADLAQRIEQAVARARKAHDSFVASSGGVSRTVAAARGASPAADAWITAQVALAGLQTLRSDAVIAQGDIDTLYADERLADPGRITPTAQALAEAQGRIAGWVDEQNAVIARLANQLRS